MPANRHKGCWCTGSGYLDLNMSLVKALQFGDILAENNQRPYWHIEVEKLTAHDGSAGGGAA